MSKQIDLSKPLSREDYQYLVERDQWDDIRANEKRFGKRTGMTGDERRARIAELEAELASLRAAEAAEGNVAQPTPSAVFPHTQGVPNTRGPVDNTTVNGEVPTGAPAADTDDYESEDAGWTMGKLRDELRQRNEDRKEQGLEPFPLGGTKSELIERLRQDDSELANADNERGAAAE